MTTKRWLETAYARYSPRLPRSLIKGLASLHTLVLIISRGYLGGSLLDRPILLLTTTGRRTGKRRIQPLMYLREEETYVVAASFGGHDDEPAWLTNLRANPSCTITVHGRDIPIRAEILPAAERERLWPRFLDLFMAYERYQAATSREIAIVLLRSEQN
jgi:deazaflavin-dependent oxidoreductase (nitroreductase family)